MNSRACGLPVHFVGSIPLANAAEVFEEVGARVGGATHAIPDGETGERLGWIRWHRKRLLSVNGLELYAGSAAEHQGKIRLMLGFRVSDLKLRPLGYLDEARRSYEDFRRARAQGQLPSCVRMQVSIPSPIALSIGVDAPFHELLGAFQKAAIDEVTELCRVIPSQDLAVQWDVCAETVAEIGRRDPEAVHANGRSLLGRWTFDQSMTCVAAVCDSVPAEVPVGVHLCYGDPDGSPIASPSDSSTVRDIANELTRRVRRLINWVHVPAPRGRNDDAFFAPFADLHLNPGTQLYIGLIHQGESAADAAARIETARRHVENFGVATECGMGRREPSAVPALLDFHAIVAALA